MLSTCAKPAACCSASWAAPVYEATAIVLCTLLGACQLWWAARAVHELWKCRIGLHEHMLGGPDGQFSWITLVWKCSSPHFQTSVVHRVPCSLLPQKQLAASITATDCAGPKAHPGLLPVTAVAMMHGPHASAGSQSCVSWRHLATGAIGTASDRCWLLASLSLHHHGLVVSGGWATCGAA